ncbi:head GIN domain-containing protein [Longitalea luteola]|uniref:head GIN domain-containing protein n=1 Tax=Longitalea luteola TaxID=2812563 RepID=UPI001A97B3C6|nr:head GIN domain-containing protein [Longitalea luteola]
MKNWTFLIFLATILVAGCRFTGKRIKGNGDVTTETRNISSFTGVASYGFFDVYVAVGSPASVKIEGESNLLPYIETFVDDGTLKVRTKKNVWFRTRKNIKVYVTAPAFKKIYAIGSGDVVGQTPVADSAELDLKVQGNGSIKLDVDAPEITAVLTGNGGINLKGQTKYFECKLQGNGNLKAFDLMAEETKVEILGNADAEVFASVKLDVSVGGNGNVRYKGNAVPSTHITGNGNIKQVK